MSIADMTTASKALRCVTATQTWDTDAELEPSHAGTGIAQKRYYSKETLGLFKQSRILVYVVVVARVFPAASSGAS